MDQQQPKPKHTMAEFNSSMRLYNLSDRSVIRKPEATSSTTPSRKRKAESDGDGGGRQLKQARLTQENLALFNRMVERKRYTAPFSSHSATETSTTTVATASLVIRTQRNHILRPAVSKPPANLEQIHKWLTRPRHGTSPSELTFRDYVKRISEAPNRATLLFELCTKLLQAYSRLNYQRRFSFPFTSFPEQVGFNDNLPVPKPGFVEGIGRLGFGSALSRGLSKGL